MTATADGFEVGLREGAALTRGRHQGAVTVTAAGLAPVRFPVTLVADDSFPAPPDLPPEASDAGVPGDGPVSDGGAGDGPTGTPPADDGCGCDWGTRGNPGRVNRGDRPACAGAGARGGPPPAPPLVRLGTSPTRARPGPTACCARIWTAPVSRSWWAAACQGPGVWRWRADAQAAWPAGSGLRAARARVPHGRGHGLGVAGDMTLKLRLMRSLSLRLGGTECSSHEGNSSSVPGCTRTTT